MGKRKKEDREIELSKIPNDKYVKFFEKFKEIETLEVPKWKVEHLLGFFCKKYKDKYNVDYQFKFNNESPSKCFEVWQMKTLVAKLTSDPQILKDYIEWVYKEKINNAKRRIISISFITNDYSVNEFKMQLLTFQKSCLQLDRSTALPDSVKQILIQFELENVSTYGDLAFLNQAMNNNHKSDKSNENFINASLALIQNDFDFSILDKIL